MLGRPHYFVSNMSTLAVFVTCVCENSYLCLAQTGFKECPLCGSLGYLEVEE